MKNLLKMWNTLDTTFSAYTPYLFALSLFLLHIPYYSITSISLFNSYLIARLLTIILFFYLAISKLFEREKLSLNQNVTIILLVLFLFATGLSSIAAFSMSAFISNYEDIVLAVLFSINCYLVCAKNFSTTSKWIVLAVIASTALSVIDELILLINPIFYMQYAQVLLHPSQYEFIQASIFRGRLFVNRYNEVFIPLFIFFIVYPLKINTKKLFLTILIILIFTLALFSGWRIRLLTSIMGIATLILFIKDFTTKKKIIIFSSIFIVFFILIVGSDNLMRSFTGYSTIGRLLFEDQQDVDALTSRLNFFKKSIELFVSSPIVGVGLGHYSLIADKPYRQFYTVFQEQKIEAELLSLNPHNIFFHLLAETGSIGLLSLVIVLIYFIFQDWSIFTQKKNSKLPIYSILISGFWILFTFAIFHGQVGFQFYALLFGFRAVLEAFKQIDI